jgi:hypothetical protein
MTDEELIARLRDEQLIASRTEAADRIEALTSRLARIVDVARAYRIATRHFGPCPETSAVLDAVLTEITGWQQ